MRPLLALLLALGVLPALGDDVIQSPDRRSELLILEQQLKGKQEEKKDGRITPERYEEWETDFRASLPAAAARVPASLENTAAHARIIALLGDRDQAYEVLDRGLAANPESPVLLRTKSQILYEQGDYPGAAQHGLEAWEKSGRTDKAAWELYQVTKGRSAPSGKVFSTPLTVGTPEFPGADLRRLNDAPKVQIPESLRGATGFKVAAPPATELTFAEYLEQSGTARITRSMTTPQDGDLTTWAGKKGLLLSGAGELFSAKAMQGQTYADLYEGALDLRSYPHYAYVLGLGVYDDLRNFYIDSKAAFQNPSKVSLAEAGSSGVLASSNFIGMGLGGPVKKIIEQTVKGVAKQTLKEVAEQGAKVVAKQTFKEAAETAAKEAVERGAKEAVERAGREAVEQAAKDALLQTPEEVAELTAKKIILERTRPSLPMNLGAKPKGKPKVLSPNEKSISGINGLNGENQAAEALARKGYAIEQLPTVKGPLKNPDFRIEGKIFDCYTPQGNNIRNIMDNVAEKVQEEQAARIVLNLNYSEVTLEALRTELMKNPIRGLREIIVLRNGVVAHF